MATNPRLRARAALTTGLTALALVVGAVPARADEPMPGSGTDTVMSTGQVILVFVGIPLVVVGIIWLLVLAPGWTRGGRAGSAEAWTSDPLVLGSDDPVGGASAPALDADAAREQTGGTSASW